MYELKNKEPEKRKLTWQFEIFLLGITGILGIAGEVFFYTLIKTGCAIPLIKDVLQNHDCAAIRQTKSFGDTG